jgi:hypothetical protein
MRKKIPLYLALVVLISLIARTLPGPRTIDDSYITFRYARNILAGEGFVYNPGERVLGTTTPFYTLLLTGLGALFGGTQAPFPVLALAVNALADAATCILLYLIGKRLSLEWAGAGAALIWAIAPFSVTFAVGGLETSFYVLFLCSTATFHLYDRHKTTAFFGALALLTRPDALILLGPIALDRLIQIWLEHRRKQNLLADVWNTSWKEAALFLAPTVLWFGFATLYFGNPLPHSIGAKAIAYQLSAEAGFVRLLQHYATPFLGHLTFGLNWIKIGLLLYPFLFVIGARASLNASPRIWPWIVYPWLYFATFSIANPLIFRWYMTPPLPAYIFMILAGVQVLANSVVRGATGRIGAKRSLTITSSGFLLLLTIAGPSWLMLQDWQLQPSHGLNRPAPEMAWYELELLYRQATEIVLTDSEIHPRPNPILAAGDVGVLGFYSGMHILDTVGLNSTESLEYYPLDSEQYVISYAIPPALILDQRPDYVVVLEVYIRNGLLKNEEFLKNYNLLAKIPNNIYGSNGLLIYYRVSN